jgi:hypothetical protein
MYILAAPFGAAFFYIYDTISYSSAGYFNFLCL